MRELVVYVLFYFFFSRCGGEELIRPFHSDYSLDVPLCHALSFSIFCLLIIPHTVHDIVATHAPHWSVRYSRVLSECYHHLIAHVLSHML